MNGSRKPALAVAAIALAQGIQWLLPVPGNAGNMALRLGISAAVFGALCVFRKARVFSSPPFLLRAALLGITFDVLPHLLLTWAAQHLQAGITAVALCSVPLLLLLQAEAHRPRNFAIAGIAGMMLASSGALDLRLSQWPYLLGLGTAATSIAFSFAYAKRLLATAPPASVLVVEQATAAIIFALLAAASHNSQAWSMAPDYVTAAFALALGGVAAWFSYWLLTKRQTADVAAIVWLRMIVSMTAVAFFLRGRPGVPMLAGAAILLVSFLCLWREHSAQERPLMIRVTPAS